jgi:hypothetical protein
MRKRVSHLACDKGIDLQRNVVGCIFARLNPDLPAVGREGDCRDKNVVKSGRQLSTKLSFCIGHKREVLPDPYIAVKADVGAAPIPMHDDVCPADGRTFRVGYCARQLG